MDASVRRGALHANAARVGKIGHWCPGGESNPHEEKSPEDFKSSASAIPPPGHRHYKSSEHNRLLQGTSAAYNQLMANFLHRAEEKLSREKQLRQWPDVLTHFARPARRDLIVGHRAVLMGRQGEVLEK